MDNNNAAVDLGINAAVKVEIPASWAAASDTPAAEPKDATPFVKDIVLPMDRQQGDKLPVSVFQKHGVLDGTWENGTSVYSKRGVVHQGAQVEPHFLHPVQPLLHELPPRRYPSGAPQRRGEAAQVPAAFETVPAKGLGKDVPNYSFRIQVSPYDCLGCGVCLTACPANQNEKLADALVMTPFEEMKAEQPLFDEVAMNDAYLKKDVISNTDVKHIQFAKPTSSSPPPARLRRDHLHQAGQPAGG